jgi:hypothetical protein
MTDKQKNTFKLCIKEVSYMDFTIEASTEDEAVEKLKGMYNNGEAVVSCLDGGGYTAILNQQGDELEEIACF